MRTKDENSSHFAISKFKVVKDGDLFTVAAEPCESTVSDSAKNMEARYEGPETADFSPTCVYRAFDDCGVLLYVGASCQVWKRLYRHWHDVSAWRNDVAFLYVETYPNLNVARAVESGAILFEDPLHNRRRLPQAFGRRSMRGYVKPGEILTSYNPFWAGVGADLRDLSPIPHPQTKTVQNDPRQENHT